MRGIPMLSPVGTFCAGHPRSGGTFGPHTMGRAATHPPAHLLPAARPYPELARTARAWPHRRLNFDKALRRIGLSLRPARPGRSPLGVRTHSEV